MHSLIITGEPMYTASKQWHQLSSELVQKSLSLYIIKEIHSKLTSSLSPRPGLMVATC